MVKSIGKIYLGDLLEFRHWYQALSVAEAETYYNEMTECIRNECADNKKDEAVLLDVLIYWYRVTKWSSHPFSETKEAKWSPQKADRLRELDELVSFQNDLQQEIQVGVINDAWGYIYLGNPRCGIIIPKLHEQGRFTPYPNYCNTTLAELSNSLQMDTVDNSIVPAEYSKTLTTAKLNDQMERCAADLDGVEKQIEDTRAANYGELAEIKAELERIQSQLAAKQREIMDELERKKTELENIKDNLETQIFLLDSQIYAIRCFAGEVFKVGQIRKGKSAADSEPIVVHQKLRFLDEDLGRLASIYSIEWDDIQQFETFLKYSPQALDVFAPNQKCVVLVRISRSGKLIGRNEDLPYTNMLKKYDYYHGRTVGIIIRNGENVYLGWTDEDRVRIDDDLLLSRVVTEVEPSTESRWESSYEKKQRKKERKKILQGIVSRSFIYNILQGIVEHTDMLPLPEGVKLNRQSQYVVYAVADTWLEDSRFGEWTEIVRRCNSKVSKGDMLLTIQRLRPEHYSRGYPSYSTDARWENVRGRGDANRTHDCVVKDCHIYRVNLIEDQKVFVSVPKGDVEWGRYNSCDPRANFELFSDEYINLTYMNSVWLEWVITTKAIGNWCIGGERVDYAYAIRYLKTAMDFIAKREVNEKALLDAINPQICTDPNWSLQLCEWKMEHGVRDITEYQAKRFAKYISAQIQSDPKLQH